MKHPLKGRPFTASALAAALAVTAIFVTVWVISGTVDLASSIITLGTWWLCAAVAATIEYIAQNEKNTSDRD